MPYQPIENHGVIGDLHTAALVAVDGTIDFMCFPTFHSPSVFAALLDDHKGGHFKLAPVAESVRHKQLYLPDTNVLLTRFLAADGVAEVSDFMPVDKAYLHRLVRRVKTVRGEMRYRLECKPAFNYARTPHHVEADDQGARFIPAGAGLSLRLRSDVPLQVHEDAAVAEFTLKQGDCAAFVLELDEPDSPARAPDFVSTAFKDTVNYWHAWMRRSSYQGLWQETVNRSALTLKLLTYVPEGSLVAAPTFGLPADIGGSRNWDYRYTWIRDAAFTLYSLTRLGYMDEVGAFMQWVLARCEELDGSHFLQIMYGIDGQHDLTENTLTHLEGYKGSAPVRIGNGAFDQLQLDSYGALLDAVYLYDKYGEPIAFDLWQQLVRLIDWVCEHWRSPDHGIWEIRGAKYAYLSSRVLSWVAVDRGYRLAQKRSLPAPLARWHEVRSAIYHDVFETFWDDELGAFVQYQGGKRLDAACLLMPLVRFSSPTDPRWLSTLRAVERELVEDSLVYRYKLDDGALDKLPGSEGSFSICTFWYVECLSRSGDVDKARFYFEKMLGYANHVGLYAEELGKCGEHLGNFPQAFTHLALISAAYDINRRLAK